MGYVILFQQADSLLDEVTKIATEQFHVYHGADYFCFTNMFQPGGVMTKTVISATSNHNIFGSKYLLVRWVFSRAP